MLLTNLGHTDTKPWESDCGQSMVWKCESLIAEEAGLDVFPSRMAISNILGAVNCVVTED